MLNHKSIKCSQKVFKNIGVYNQFVYADPISKVNC